MKFIIYQLFVLIYFINLNNSQQNQQQKFNTNLLFINNNDEQHKQNFIDINKSKNSNEKTIKIDTLSNIFKKSFNKIKSKNKKNDIVFLIDSSSSVGKFNFQSEIKFVKKILSDLTVSYNNTRVSVITFSSQGKIIRHIDQISYPKEENDKCRLLNYEIPKIKFIGGGTFTFGALKKAKETFSKARPDSRKIIFLITDGFSNGRDPVPISKQIKNENVTIFTIGIQTGNFAELYNISSVPGEQYSFLLDSFPQFESLARKALHSDYKGGKNIRVSDQTLCNTLCSDNEINKNLNGTLQESCCDKNANCVCGTTSGHYSCMCREGFYGSGLKNSCEVCPESTFWQSWNLCRPCPDINHITIKKPATSVLDCVCKTGFKIGESNRCEVITCPQLSPPENGYFVKHPIGCGHVLNAACGARCTSGFQLSGSSIRLCQEDRTWSGNETSCILKTCRSLMIPYYGQVICKNVDLDLKFDYSPRNVTFIEKYDDESLRITESMPIDTDCNFKCGPGFYLVGSANRNCLPLSKWDGIQTACKQILCPVLPIIPNGEYDPTDCTEIKQYHGSNCTLICNEGYELKGPQTKSCGGKRNGVWTQKLKTPRCVDIQKPNITCPNNYTVAMRVDTNFAFLKSLKLPEVSDNSKLNVTFWSKPAIKEDGIKLFIGKYTFTYIAMDTSKNKARCNFTITVIDDTKPSIDNCISPSEFLINSSSVNTTFIEWDDPIIYDNSNRELNVTQSLEPGYLGFGNHQVKYVVYDESNNTNSCIMNITVNENKCLPLLSPRNGQTICAENKTHVWCEITCNSGHVIFDIFEEDNLDSLKLICDNNNPNWSYKILPDCAEIKLPTHVEEIFSISLDSNSTICNNTNTSDTIQAEILMQIHEHFCNGQDDCEIVSEIPICEEDELKENDDVAKPIIDVSNTTFYNIVKRDVQFVDEITQKRRIIRNRAQLKINVYTKVSKRLGLWEQNATRSDNIKRVKAELKTLPNNDRLKQALINMNINLNILKLDQTIRCENGSISKKFVCVQCPSGTFHNKTSFICQSCSIGQFQMIPGQLECHNCPIHYSTRKIQSKTIDECKEQCYPGTMARIKSSKRYKYNTKPQKSLMPFCKKCNPGEYQSSYDQINCEQCPEGYTSIRGSTKPTDCYPKRIDPCIKYKTICGLNGQCIPDEITDYLYSCLCDDGYIGSHCEHQLNLCYDTPCINGGKCNTVNNTIQCECSSQYKGDYCETVIDICDDDICKNNGHCIEVKGKAICECENGFTGDYCENKIDYCENTPCEYGTCINKPYGYYCQCAPGFFGRRCHLVPCDYLPCGRAICVNLPHFPATRDSYMCKCPIGFKGDSCNQIDNPCDKFPCRNNGECYPIKLRNITNYSHYVNVDGDEIYEKFTCKCQPYFYGNNCQTFVTPDFVLNFEKSNVNDYVQLNGPTAHLKEISFCTWIKTNDTFNYGVILSYASIKSDNMFTFTDYNGFVLYVDGNHIVTDLTVNDGYWHFICVSWQSDYGLYEIYVDGNLFNTGYNLSTNSYIEANGSITLGQEQDDLGSSFSESEAFIGEIAYFDIWNYTLSPHNVQEYYLSCEPYQGNLITWTDFRNNIKGNVKILSSPFCKPCQTDIILDNGMIRILDNRAYHYCKNGYRLRGPSILHCLRTSEWEHPKPTCLAINCGPIYAPINGYVETIKTNLGQQAIYTCKDGYQLIGIDKRLCLQNATWEHITPECQSDKKCDGINIYNSLIYYNNERDLLKNDLTYYPIGTIAEIQCLNNTNPNGETLLTCIENGLWDYPLPTCQHANNNFDILTANEEKENNRNRMNKNLNDDRNNNNNNDTPLNTTVENILRNLIESGKHPDREFWQNLKDFLFYGCQIRNNLKLSMFCVDSLRNYSDLTNFDSPGSEEYQNMDDKFLKLLQDAVIIQIKTNYKITPDNLLDFILYNNKTILKKYDLIIETTYRLVFCFYIDSILLEDEFKIDNPIINVNRQIQLLIEYLIEPINIVYKQNINKCKRNALPENVRKSRNDKEQYDIGTEIIYSCDVGQKLKKNDNHSSNNTIASTTCQSNGEWNNINVTCENILCDKPPRPTSMTIKTKSVKTLYEIGDRIEYECKIGYVIYGNPIIECLTTRKWTKILARCSKISCNKPKLINGLITQGHSYLYQDKLNIQCSNTDYVYEIECNSDGNWHPNDDFCQ